MTAKEYLSRAAILDKAINCKLHQVEMLRSLTRQTTASYSNEPVSRTKNVRTLQATIAKLIDAENELNKQIDELVDIKIDIALTIGRVQNNVEQLILEKRYLCFQRWDTIASEMQFSRREVFRKHRSALESVERLLHEQEFCA